MNIRLLTGLMIAAAFFLTACDKAQEPTEPGATAEEKTALQSAVDAAKEAGGKLAEQAGEMTAAAVEKGKELTAAAMERSKEMIEKSKEQIADGKVGLAAATLTQLQKIKPSLPESLQDEITSLEEMLAKNAPAEAAVAADTTQEAAKAAEGVSAEAEAKMEPPKE